jgi:hypothetical protein
LLVRNIGALVFDRTGLAPHLQRDARGGLHIRGARGVPPRSSLR